MIYGTAGELWRVSVGGGEPQKLGGMEPNAYNQAGIAVSSDGNRIAYVAEEPRRSEVWVLPNLLHDGD